jgi:hypothetical protein
MAEDLDLLELVEFYLGSLVKPAGDVVVPLYLI